MAALIFLFRVIGFDGAYPRADRVRASNTLSAGCQSITGQKKSLINLTRGNLEKANADMGHMQTPQNKASTFMLRGDSAAQQ